MQIQRGWICKATSFRKDGRKFMDNRTENAMGQATREMTDTAREAKDRLSETTHEAGNRISGAWQNARDAVQERTRASVEATDRTVREHPYASIGVAFCSGLLLGVLLARGR
jgi:ElaB/YqjD/DUF883 family membrane-anchored ribosome-binding protein